jgi:hypothetical protein
MIYEWNGMEWNGMEWNEGSSWKRPTINNNKQYFMPVDQTFYLPTTHDTFLGIN